MLATATNPDGYVHSCADTYSDPYANSDSDAHGDRDSNSYTYFDTETFTDAKSCANAQGSSYSAAAPVTYPYENKTHCSIRGLWSAGFNMFDGRLHSRHLGERKHHHGH